MFTGISVLFPLAVFLKNSATHHDVVSESYTENLLQGLVVPIQTFHQFFTVNQVVRLHQAQRCKSSCALIQKSASQFKTATTHFSTQSSLNLLKYLPYL